MEVIKFSFCIAVMKVISNFPTCIRNGCIISRESMKGSGNSSLSVNP